MPDGRLERAIFGFGLIAIVALALVVALSWKRQYEVVRTPTTATTPAGRSPTAPAPATQVAPTLAPATSTTIETTTPSSPPTTTPTNATITQATAPITLILTAVRGASWIEVRDGSDAGTILYTGTLTTGTAKTFHAAATLYVRFGTAGSINASVDGHARRLKPGTYTARFDSTGYAFAHS